MTYKIKLLYDAPGWAHWKRCMILREYAPPDFDVDVGCGGGGYTSHRYDLMLQLCCGHATMLRNHFKSHRHGTILVSGLNVGFNDRNRAWLCRNLEVSDHVLINNRDTWERSGKLPRTSWISNGVDLRHWRIVTPPERREPKVIFLGSLFHTEPSRDTKGYHRFLVPLAKKLKEHGIASEFRRVDSIGPRRYSDGKLVFRHADYSNNEELRDWYNTGTVYVVASETEGTPNPAFEAAACGATICATRVGCMPKLIEPGINGELVGWNLEEILAGVLKCQENYPTYSAAMQRTIQAWDWAARAAEYYALFRRLLVTAGPADLPQSPANVQSRS